VAQTPAETVAKLLHWTALKMGDAIAGELRPNCAAPHELLTSSDQRLSRNSAASDSC